MRIERHQVGQAAVSAARTDFTNRIGSQVRSMSKADRMTTYDWRMIADEFLDYLGALSVETPDLDTPEAKAALKDASEAAAGSVAYAAYHPHCSFHVFLEYVNFGMSYEPGEDAPEESVTAWDWIDALCLAVLRDRAQWHGEAFHFARQKFAAEAQGTPVGELVTGLTAVVLDDTGNEDEYPPSTQHKLAAVDAALERVRARAAETGRPLLDQPDSVALHALRTLVVEDRDAFDTALAGLLTGHAARQSPAASPSTLLPLVPLALAALAYRTLGWTPAVASDYLPHALVTGFETRGPRVGGLGRDRRPDAVAALAAGPLVVERPACERDGLPQVEALYEKSLRKAFSADDGAGHVAVWRLGMAMNDQERLFKWRAGNPGHDTGAQLAAVRLASRLGAALFRIAMAEPGTDVELVIDGHTVRCAAERGDRASAGNWQTAVSLALITGAREDLAPLVLTGPVFAQPDGSAFAAYRKALHAYLTGDDPETAAQLALREAEKAKDWGFPMPPAVLLSQLVEGDEESFNLALADALEAHRAHHQVADRGDDPDASVNLDVLALACHARRRGWAVRVDSPYLPLGLLRTAEPF